MKKVKYDDLQLAIENILLSDIWVIDNQIDAEDFVRQVLKELEIEVED